jgi:hypothetical protein
MMRFHFQDCYLIQWFGRFKGLTMVMGENPLRGTTQDKNGIVLTTIIFYFIF